MFVSAGLPSYGGSYGAPSYGGAPHHDQPSGDITNSCNSGPVQCCNQTFDAGSKESTFLHSAVGAVVGAVTAQAGVACNPITAIGVGSGGQCSSQPVCCTGNHMNGLVVVGCSPVNVNA
ncbi:fungal hydrophobin [Agrocybe pediades]|nr:fungal hydrophobin [Agrocybe pediades]